jgi:alpha-tubulin suppressor-like RCC1 family protein
VRIGTDTDWTAISVGDIHTVALKSDGSLWAWGYNDLGQLGVGDTTGRRTPVRVGAETDWSAIAAGHTHTVALKSDGSLWAWGRNHFGKLGDGTTEHRNVPVKIMEDVVYISASNWSSMAIKADGSLWAWGSNAQGQLGDGTHENRKTPVYVMSGVTAVSASGGSHSMAIKEDGSLWTWGWQDFSQLGDENSREEDGVTIVQNIPTKIMYDVVAISAGDVCSMAIQADGSLWEWCHLLSDIEEDQATPIKMMGDVVSVSTSWSHVMVIKTDGSLWAWGRNGEGELGNGVPVENVVNMEAVSIDGLYVKGIVDGEHRYGSILGGLFLPDGQVTPVKIMDDVVAVSAGGVLALGMASSFTMAIRSDGSLWMWGSNGRGQLGIGTVSDEWEDRGIGKPTQIMTEVMLPTIK